nr:DNA replication/repair protein RecF [Phaeovibrio sulfidiphilus]
MTRPGAHVERLTLSRFRCHGSVRLESGHPTVVLVGPNGAGKTNLLEALSFLAPGRGLRNAALGDVGQWTPARPPVPGDPLVWAVSARVRIGGADEVSIGTGLEASGRPGAREKRVVQIDGQPAAGHAALGALFPVLWLTPEMDPLFRDAAQERRRFLDRFVAALDPGHTGRASAYARAQRERLRLLRSPQRPPGAWLDALEDVMARHGVALVAARRDLLDRLGAAVSLSCGPFPGVRLDMDSDVDRWLASGPALAAEDRLRDALAASRETDAQRDITTAGPHRDDLLAWHGTTGAPAHHSSTGEQKAMLVALLLAQSRVLSASRGVSPLLLLDDVAAHLDGLRRDALFEALRALGSQVWVSGTDRELFGGVGPDALFLRLENGAIL